MTEVFSLVSHGQIVSANVLDHKQRNRIPIISIGKEGEATYATPTYILIQYFMQKHGGNFMKKLLTILIEHGEKYTTSFTPNSTMLEKDIRFLFDVNQQDQKRRPSTVLRAYYGRASIVDIDLFVKMHRETLLYRSLFKKNKFDRNNPIFFQSDMSYLLETMYYSSDSMMFNLVSPFGLLRFNELKKSFDVLQRIPQEGVALKTILDYIHGMHIKNKILFLICCKELDNQTMMDFDIHQHPLETIHTRSLVQMMTSLKLNDTSQRKLKTTRKRKKDTTHHNRSRKRTKINKTK